MLVASHFGVTRRRLNPWADVVGVRTIGDGGVAFALARRVGAERTRSRIDEIPLVSFGVARLPFTTGGVTDVLDERRVELHEETAEELSDGVGVRSRRQRSSMAVVYVSSVRPGMAFPASRTTRGRALSGTKVTVEIVDTSGRQTTVEIILGSDRGLR